MLFKTLGREDTPKSQWIVEDCIANWWRPNFDPPRVSLNFLTFIIFS